MNSFEVQALLLSLQVAVVTLLISTPIALVLATVMLMRLVGSERRQHAAAARAGSLVARH